MIWRVSVFTEIICDCRARRTFVSSRCKRLKSKESYISPQVNIHFACLESTTRTSSHGCWDSWNRDTCCLNPEKNWSQRIVWLVSWMEHVPMGCSSDTRATCRSLSPRKQGNGGKGAFLVREPRFFRSLRGTVFLHLTPIITKTQGLESAVTAGVR